MTRSSKDDGRVEIDRSSLHERRKLEQEHYAHEAVYGLTPITKWSDDQVEANEKLNRVLQPGFAARSAKDLMSDIEAANADPNTSQRDKIEWLTDVICPTPEAELMLHISALLVVDYKVSEDDLQTKGHEVFSSLVASYPTLLTDLQTQINAEMAKLSLPIGSAAERIARDKAQAELTKQLVKAKLDEVMPEAETKLALERKPVHDPAATTDYCFLGAAGSGKSTMTRADFNTTNPKTNYAVIATDVYRSVTMPGTTGHERIPTADGFTRTQDIAYMVRERVNALIDEGNKAGMRPGLIIDGVTLDGKARGWLQATTHAGGIVDSRVAAFPGDGGYTGIASRAHRRAGDPLSSPGDIGRHTKTSALLGMHASGSADLLSSIPANMQTTVVNTSVSPPTQMALIDTKEHTIDVSDLSSMSTFMGKKDLPTKAAESLALLFKDGKRTTHATSKAQSVVDLVSKNTNGTRTRFTPDGTDYVVRLTKNGTHYATLRTNRMGKPTLDVVNVAKFRELTDPRKNSIEGQILNAISEQCSSVLSSTHDLSAKLARPKMADSKPSFVAPVSPRKATPSDLGRRSP